MRALACCAAFGAGQAVADEGLRWSFNGFGTLGWVQTDSDRVQFVRDRQPAGAGRGADAGVDSNLGLQLSAALGERLTGTVQVLDQRRQRERPSAEVEWAYARLEPVEGLALRAGRIALPMFLISDSRNVGYAHTGVRPPNEVYALALLTRLQGADLGYRTPLAQGMLGVSGLVGTSSFYAPGGVKVDVKRVNGINLQWENAWLTLRLGRVAGRVQLDAESDDYTFEGAGALIERDPLVVQAEYVRRRSALRPEVVNAVGGYLLLGYRVGAGVPYASYARTRQTSAGHAVALSGKQSTLALGWRWNAWPSAALKFQLERVDSHGTAGISFASQLPQGSGTGPPPEAPPRPPGPAGPPAAPGSAGPNPQGAQGPGRPVHAFSVTLDFVF